MFELDRAACKCPQCRASLGQVERKQLPRHAKLYEGNPGSLTLLSQRISSLIS